MIPGFIIAYLWLVGATVSAALTYEYVGTFKVRAYLVVLFWPISAPVLAVLSAFHKGL